MDAIYDDAQHQEPDFEAGIARLEQIVSLLERGDAPLKDSMNLFAEGTSLVNSCTRLLEEARQQVVVLRPGPDGMPEEIPFEKES